MLSKNTFRNIFEKPNRVFATWLFSYIIILAIYITMAVIISTNSSRLLKDAALEANLITLSKVQKDLDYILADSIGVIDEVARDTTVSNAVASFSTEKNTNFYRAHEIGTRLNFYTLGRKTELDTYIYIKSANLIISRYTILETEKFYDIYIKDSSKMTYDEWITYIFSSEGNLNIKSRMVSETGSLIYISRSLPLLYGGNESNASIVITVDGTNILSESQNIDRQSYITDLAILDESYKLIVSLNNSDFIKNMDIDQLRNSDGFFTESFASDKIVVSHVPSTLSYMDLNYVLAVPYDVFWSIVNSNRVMVFAGIFVVLLLGGSICFVFLYKNYIPISRIVDLLREKYQVESGQKNELAYIQSTIGIIEAEKEKINHTLKTQNQQLRVYTLSRLLKGNLYTSTPIEESLDVLDIHFISDHFSVLLFYIEKDEDAFLSGEGTDQYENFNLSSFLVSVLVEELAENSGNRAYVTNIDNLISCVFNYSNIHDNPVNVEVHKTTEADYNDSTDISANYQQTIRIIVDHAVQFLSSHFHITLTTAASSVYHELSGISRAYLEALEILEYKHIHEIGGQILFNDVLEKSGKDFYYPLETEQLLINYMQTGDFDHASELLNFIFDRNFEENRLPSNMARFLMIDLACTIVKSTGDLKNPDRVDFYSTQSGENDPINVIIQCENMTAMKKELTQMVRSLCLRNAEKNKAKPEYHELSEKIKKYVAENYNNHDLGVTSIAEEFHVHIVYLSKAFKEVTGEGLLEHINFTRIQKSKVFLKRGANLEETSSAVGFSNVRTFIRVFKKYEGITPGKFKAGN